MSQILALFSCVPIRLLFVKNSLRLFLDIIVQEPVVFKAHIKIYTAKFHLESP